MKIGIIGAGNIGGALARRFRAVGHEVAVANSRGPASLSELARETGATAATVEDAARGKDVVVVTIPWKNIVDLPRDLFAGASSSLVVIDTNNYYPRHRDGRIAEIEDGLTESRWVERQLKHRSSKRSTRSWPSICSSAAFRRERRDGSRSRSPATIRRRRRS